MSRGERALSHLNTCKVQTPAERQREANERNAKDRRKTDTHHSVLAPWHLKDLRLKRHVREVDVAVALLLRLCKKVLYDKKKKV